jgi:hypothetical protein
MFDEQSNEAPSQGTVYTYTVPNEEQAYQKNSIAVGRGRMRSLPKYQISIIKYQDTKRDNILLILIVLSLPLMM